MKNPAHLLAAVNQLNANIAAGHDVQWSLRLVAERNLVDRGDLALLTLEKFVGCSRARAAVEAMQEHDAALDQIPGWKHKLKAAR